MKFFREIRERLKRFLSFNEMLEQANLFKIISENSDDVIWIYDLIENKFTYVSPSVKKLRGYSQQEALNQSLIDRLSAESKTYVSEQIPKRISAIEAGDYSLKVAKDVIVQLHKNGNMIPTEVITNFIVNDKGKAIKIVGITRDITEQKNANIALKQSRNQLQAVLDTSLDAITLTNPDGIFLACNKTLLQRWNKSREEMLNHPASEFLPPDIYADRMEKINNCISGKTEIYFIDNYNNHYFENTISPIIETDGNVKTVALFSRDITEKKLAEINLQKEHDLLVDILESMTDAFISIDRNLCCTYMNQNAGKIFNCDPQEKIGKNILMEFPDEIGEFLLINYEKALEEQTYSHTEIFYPPFNKWFEQRIFPSNDGIVIFFQDITERKKVLQSIEESEARYRFLFENNPLPMLIYERITFKMLAVNEAFTIHYGYSHDEIKSLLLTDLYPEPENKKIMEVASALKGHANVGEWHHIKKDGTIITIIAQSHDINYMGKSARVAVLTDISDRKLVEMEILKLNKELESRVLQRTSQLETAYKDMEAFTYSVSHDLRAPLRAITGFSEIIARRYLPELNSEVQHYLDNIIKASKRMGMLIDDLLIYSRLGRHGVTFVPIQLTEILESVADDFSITLKEINGVLDIQKDMPVVSGDKSLLNRIFSNLVENAVKYRKPDIPVVIKIWTENNTDKVMVYVKDNGIGIPPEHHKRIFNIFQRLHSDDKYPGTGIGLATVKKSLELLNGNINVESEPGKGSTFIIELFKDNQ